MGLQLVRGPLLALFLVGCSMPAVTATVGRYNGMALATVEVREAPQVRAKCLNDKALACTQVGDPDGDGIRGVTLIFTMPAAGMPEYRTVYAVAHELCHAVAILQALPDPCHDQDHGVAP